MSCPKGNASPGNKYYRITSGVSRTKWTLISSPLLIHMVRYFQISCGDAFEFPRQNWTAKRGTVETITLRFVYLSCAFEIIILFFRVFFFFLSGKERDFKRRENFEMFNDYSWISKKPRGRLSSETAYAITKVTSWNKTEKIKSLRALVSVKRKRPKESEQLGVFTNRRPRTRRAG